MVFLQLFYTFFKIGLFGFGGGYAMLSMIQGEVVTRYGWLTAQEFTDIVAISQMTPGPIGINSATYVGYTTIADCYGTSYGILGSIIATFAVVLSFFPTDADHQQILSEIPETSFRGSGIQWAPPGSGRSASLSRAGIDEFGKLQFSQRRHIFLRHQLPHLPRGIYRHKEI